MSGLGPKLASNIATLRQEEIDAAAAFRLLGAVTSSIALAPQSISTVVGFALFCIIALRSGETLDVTRMFSSLSLILLLGSPLFLMFETILDLHSARGCLERIEKFLQEGTREDYRSSATPLLQSESGSKDPAGSSAQRGPEVEALEMRHFNKNFVPGASSESRSGPIADLDLHDVSFSWTADGQPAVKKINLSVKKGQFAMIVGPVASGKSTLLKGLLGELSLASGRVTVSRSKLSWCDQTPWLMVSFLEPVLACFPRVNTFQNNTIKKNIIGFSHFDPELYQQVIRACDLEKDFSQLENGDETKVGSKGAALSGGQKQRVVGAWNFATGAKKVVLIRN